MLPVVEPPAAAACVPQVGWHALLQDVASEHARTAGSTPGKINSWLTRTASAEIGKGNHHDY
jgi:hypothetical protein